MYVNLSPAEVLCRFLQLALDSGTNVFEVHSALPSCRSRVPSSPQNLTREQADYCVSHMKPYVDGKGRELPAAFDYVEFTRSLFVN